MKLKLEGHLATEEELDELVLGEDDAGRTWWVDFTWFIWSGKGWVKAIATTEGPNA
ncbi:hypothetical protein PXH78_26990 [Mycolicibacterium smegmatis]|uniref:hypothetical protein n=1 Tax=Mycolicibacterium smegmatis TaxID=1772 RepID=UPI0005D748BE|nr:hypothetical protein [Mycolicibacterium smegmatis]MDF1902759.1 hypothetical protein [Mycolicibacterium smegmatis]MDF1909035.1 hypothetical protein [Mycolicibacterium smegmatis]MDF1921254.1 hypothetical protein [Mycolicibacterium smegmatis]MDF1927519.1 hypothetical protein [Mycolicibacterium smegmatis]UAK53374.1 hypothetical protein K8P01_22550 [Mycolicibacterium smegmatis]